MAEKKPVTPTTARTVTTAPAKPRATETKQHVTGVPLFYKENYMWMIIGAVVVAIGMLLMLGGKNSDANQFDYNLVYSTTRTTIAPLLILAGLTIEIFAIFKKPRLNNNEKHL
jgi:hypothetical protein